MIFDKLVNINNYGIDLQFVIENLNKGNFASGKFEIKDAELFGIGLDYETKDSSEGLWEAHRRYLDIHVVLKGEEIIHITDIGLMKSSKEYEDDYELFVGEKEHAILLKPGYFLALFPHEVHKTSIKNTESNFVKKLVFKKLL